MNTKEIIDRCLRAIGEEDPDNPVEMTRPEVLSLINEFYQNEIGELLRNMTSIVYDGNDADHTITAGAGILPSDFLLPARVYDGDAPKNKPLEQIFDIDDRESDTSKTSQYMIPNTTEIWIFGKTPTSTIKMYYYAKPEPLEDDSSSSPTAWNVRKRRYEVHSLNHRGNTFACLVPNNRLDARVEEALRRGDLRVRGKQIFREIDEHNERLERSSEMSRRNDLLGLAEEMHPYFRRLGWEGL